MIRVLQVIGSLGYAGVEAVVIEAVVIKSITEHGTYVGVPARKQV